MEYADEYRLETIVPQAALAAVIKAMEAAHPYEEVAYDVFRLENGGTKRGIGRIGQLEETLSLAAFLALCGGSGLSYMQAAKKAGADVYVTGDMKYHDGQAASELGLCVVDAGHFGTERLITHALADFVQQQGLDAVIFEEEDYLQHWRR